MLIWLITFKYGVPSVQLVTFAVKPSKNACDSCKASLTTPPPIFFRDWPSFIVELTLRAHI